MFAFDHGKAVERDPGFMAALDLSHNGIGIRIFAFSTGLDTGIVESCNLNGGFPLAKVFQSGFIQCNVPVPTGVPAHIGGTERQLVLMAILDLADDGGGGGVAALGLPEHIGIVEPSGLDRFLPGAAVADARLVQIGIGVFPPVQLTGTERQSHFVARADHLQHGFNIGIFFLRFRHHHFLTSAIDLASAARALQS